jgi:hypothetical protein
MKITLEEAKKHNELYELAITRYLDKTDFSASEWLDGADLETFTKLDNKINGEGK